MFGNNSGFSFGNKPASNTGNTGGLFGSNTANKPTGFGGNTTSGFGGNTASGFGGNTTSGLGGNSTSGFGGNTTTAGFGNTTSGFGSKPAGTGFSFGGNTAGQGGSTGTGNATTGLFGNNSASGGLLKPATSINTNSGSAPFALKPSSGGLFSKPAASGGLFGSNTTSSGFSFGSGANNGANTTTNNTLFANNNINNGNNNNNNNNAPQLQLTSMTKVSDLPEGFRKQLEQLDEYIQTQVAISEYLKNNEGEHKELIESIPRDINFLEKKYVATNQALNSDLKFIETFKTKTLESFNDWVEKLIKVYLQLTNPMSRSSNDQNRASNSATVVIGVNGSRSGTSQGQQKQKQAPSDKDTPLNVTQILNSYYVSKIEDFKESIGKYQLVLQEVENSINDLDKASVNGGGMALGSGDGIQMVVSTLQEEFKLYVELANEFAEIHHRVNRVIGGPEAF
ncbi:DEKNAAC102781 [Brettanomyces naardenensis]|uniref:DEKNAAC102781 n=1 Tax=Brettanomyces naardenensis TaxID=13370 RepID=A0A448YLQ3_BRENA|nr:DEKNAAC102781 [Brettanomyces naardenensis]